MMLFRLRAKALAVIAAAVGLAGTVALVARPQTIESTVLGTAWECTVTAFVLTTCAPRLQQAVPSVETSRKVAVRPVRG